VLGASEEESMSRLRRKAIILVCVFALTAGVSAQTKSAADESAIAKIRAAYQTALGTSDGAAIAKLYAPDGVEMPPNEPGVKGRASIEALHKRFGQQFMVHGITITPTETKVIGDYAYEIGTYKQNLMPMKGGAIVDDHGKYVVLFKKDASGNWWITHAMNNTDVPLPAPPAKK
jgi:uncharacterized protein (TIGR02246 family)